MELRWWTGDEEHLSGRLDRVVVRPDGTVEGERKVDGKMIGVLQLEPADYEWRVFVEAD